MERVRKIERPLNPDFKVMPLFNAEYFINRTRCGHRYYEILIRSYAVLNGVISKDLNDFE